MTRNTTVRRIAMAAAALTACVALDTHAGDVYGRRVAVCVGINAYDGYPKLSYAVNDAVEMARTFEQYGFDDVTLLTDADADGDGILDALQKASDRMGANDLFVFFYAGHGWTGLDAQGSKMGYILPRGARKGQEVDDGVSMQQLRELVQAMPNRDSLFLMDACYSGYGLQVETTATGSGRSIQMLTAGGELDRAFEADGHGLFTKHMLHCFNRASRDKGHLTAMQLARFVYQRVKQETSGWQTPHFGRMGEGDIVIAVRDSAALAMAR